MDDPALDVSRHRHALRGLARLNRWSRSAEIVWDPIERLAQAVPHRPLRLLDVATGSGDLPLALWHRAKQRGVSIDCSGCDRSPVAIRYAQERARHAVADIRFFIADALTDLLPAESAYDIVTCSLFLHHLSEADTVRLLRTMHALAGQLVVVNDLTRSLPGLGLAYLGSHLLTRSSIVHADGPQSVRAAYTLREIEQLAHDAGLTQATVVRRWPCRFLLSWRTHG